MTDARAAAWPPVDEPMLRELTGLDASTAALNSGGIAVALQVTLKRRFMALFPGRGALAPLAGARLGTRAYLVGRTEAMRMSDSRTSADLGVETFIWPLRRLFLALDVLPGAGVNVVAPVLWALDRDRAPPRTAAELDALRHALNLADDGAAFVVPVAALAATDETWLAEPAVARQVELELARHLRLLGLPEPAALCSAPPVDRPASRRASRRPAPPDEKLVGVRRIREALNDAQFRVSSEELNAALSGGEIAGAHRDPNHPRKAWTCFREAALAWVRRRGGARPPTR